jgi:hypothetical protein
MALSLSLSNRNVKVGAVEPSGSTTLAREDMKSMTSSSRTVATFVGICVIFARIRIAGTNFLYLPVSAARILLVIGVSLALGPSSGLGSLWTGGKSV